MATTMAPPTSLAGDSVSDTSSMLDMVASDFSVSDGASENASETLETSDAPVEISDENLTDQEIETPEPLEEEEAEDEPVVAPVAKETTQEEELPEGVSKGKNRRGEEGLFVTPERWKNIYGNHQLAQQGAEVVGEPLTLEVLQSRQAGSDAYSYLMADFKSADPVAQGRVVDYLFTQMKEAVANGEVAKDPSVAFIETLYDRLAQDGSDSAANRTLRMRAAKSLISELYEEAATNNDTDLGKSLHHVVRALTGQPANMSAVQAAAERAGLPFHTLDKLSSLPRSNDPVTQLQRENESLKQQLNKGRNGQADQFSQWETSTKAETTKAVSESVISPSLTAAQDAWKDFPEQYQRLVVKPLTQKLIETLNADSPFQDRLNLLTSNARNAQSAQIRAKIQNEIKQLYINRAKISIEGLKKPILADAAKLLKQGSDATHVQRQAGQQRTAVKGAAGTVPRSIVPPTTGNGNGVFDPNTAVRELSALLR